MSRIIKSSYALNAKTDKPIRIRSLYVQSEIEIETGADPSLQIEQMLQEAAEASRKLISEAEEEARRIIENARNDKQQIEMEEIPGMMEAAKQDGYRSGFETGRDDGYREMREAVQLARKTVQDSQADYQERIESAQETIVKLSVKIAEKIIGQKLGESQEFILQLVKRAVKEAREYTEVQLHVHPMHYQLLLSEKESLTSLFPRETDLYIYPDEELAVTGCIIESSNGRIDASVDSQLQEIKSKLSDLLKGE
ncbi:flagellar assembly protein FliH [Peribacillus kribbensis]|uniref:flagellar assembly protein FliH n=1 Tax=Peribacillus kribbensis TaxID=356658 RepID=UPI00040A906E|nr:flagellar assembly protein FliH [Peribacillus kribbensis]